MSMDCTSALRAAIAALISVLAFWVPDRASAAPGEVDPSFGNIGRNQFSGGGDNGTFIAQAPDGHILAVTTRTVSGFGVQISITQLSSEGVTDLSFGSNGAVLLDALPFYTETVRAIAMQPDGKLLIVGHHTPEGSGGQNAFILRVNADGAVDSTFATQGVLDLNLGTYGDTATAVIVQNDGKIAIAGSITDSNTAAGGMSAFAIARLNTDGSLDSSFDGDGIKLFDPTAPIHTAAPYSLRQRDDGGLIIAGSGRFLGSQSISVLTYAAVVLDAHGALDRGFNGTGELVGAHIFSIRTALVLSDNRLLFGADEAPQADSNTVLLLLRADGSRDDTFGTNGFATFNFGAIVDQPPYRLDTPYTLAVDHLGRFLIGGAMGLQPTGSPQFIVGTYPFVARVSRSGNIDTTFGNQGATVLDFVGFTAFSTPTSRAAATSVIPLNTGGVLVGTARLNQYASVTRLLAGAGRSPGLVTFSAIPSTDTVVTESTPTTTFRVRRTGGATGAITVDYAFDPGRRATAGKDFDGTGGTLSWGSGDYSDRIVSVPIINDSVAEDGNEDFQLYLNTPTGGAIAGGLVTGKTIADDDPYDGTAGRVGFQVVAQRVPENGGGVTFNLERRGGASTQIDVDYTVSGTASLGSDYTLSPAGGRITFAAGDLRSTTINIGFIRDSVVEDDEDVVITLTSATPGVVLENTVARAVIAGTRIIDGAGVLQFVEPTMTVTESAGSAVLRVARLQGAVGDVSVEYSLESATATLGSDFSLPVHRGTLHWGNGDSSDRTISIGLINDSDQEPDETIHVLLGSPVGGVGRTNVSATVTIADDDPIAPAQHGELAFTASNLTVSESAGTANIQVTRVNGSTGEATVDYSITGGDATAGADFILASGTLVWADGDAAVKVISVTVNNDTADEPDENIQLTLSNPTGGSIIGKNSVMTLTITDDDAPTAGNPPPSGGGGPSTGGNNGSGGGGGSLDFLVLAALLGTGARRLMTRVRCRGGGTIMKIRGTTHGKTITGPV